MAIGTAVLRVPKEAQKDQIIRVQMVITHPMASRRRDPQTGQEIPGHFLTKLQLFYNDQLVSEMIMATGVSANPFIALPLKADSSGVIKIAYEDNRGGKWERTTEITVK
jgi:sulfur-oxidizing protein SoxZ